MNLALLFPLIFLAIFLFIATLAVRSPKKKLDEENGLTPIFEEICGGRINSINYTWPLVRHSIYNEFVVIKCLGSNFIIPRKTLSIENADGFISSGIRYKSSKYIGNDLRIWTTNKQQVEHAISK